jgi:Peptidase family M28
MIPFSEGRPGRLMSFVSVGLLLLTVRSGSADEPAKIVFDAIAPAIIQERLEHVTRKLPDRRAALESLFQTAGCKDERLTQQPVPRSKEPNVICTLTGETDRVIVVGAHFDLVDRGIGAVDDWSGAALLPSLYQSLASKPRRHRFVFIGFAAEEIGLYGSKEYV